MRINAIVLDYPIHTKNNNILYIHSASRLACWSFILIILDASYSGCF